MAKETVRYVIGRAVEGSMEFRRPKLRIELVDICDVVDRDFPILGRRFSPVILLPNSSSPAVEPKRILAPGRGSTWKISLSLSSAGRNFRPFWSAMTGGWKEAGKPLLRWR